MNGDPKLMLLESDADTDDMKTMPLMPLCSQFMIADHEGLFYIYAPCAITVTKHVTRPIKTH